MTTAESMRAFLAPTSGFWCLVASLGFTPALGGQSTQPTAVPGAAQPPQAPAEWLLRVPLDSGEVRVEVSSRAAAVTVVAPTGTFLQAFATSRPLAEWAARLEALPPPVAGGQGAPTDVADLVGGVGRLTTFSLTRARGDSSGGYVLSGTNGAWLFALKMSASQAGALLGALRGDSAWGALTYEYPRSGRSRDGDRPHVSGAWLGPELDREAGPGPRPPRPTYPAVLRGTGTAGTVRLQFIIESTGHVRPSSVRLIGAAHPRAGHVRPRRAARSAVQAGGARRASGCTDQDARLHI
jgi:hypothetical protein